MTDIFVDAGVWFAMLHGGRSPVRDAARVEATRVYAARLAAGWRVVTTNLVVAEAHGLLCARDNRSTARRFLDDVAASVVVVTSTAEVEARALAEWIDRYDDHAFSLTDAVSFAVMRERGIRQVLAFDRHFAAAGFDVLPG